MCVNIKSVIFGFEQNYLISNFGSLHPINRLKNSLLQHYDNVELQMDLIHNSKYLLENNHLMKVGILFL